MTSTGNFPFIQRLIKTGKFKILVQSGMLKNGAVVARPEFGDSPLLSEMMEGRIKDPLAAKAFEYWSNFALTDKWLALPPKSATAMAEIYRAAYAKMMQDPEFIDRGKKISDDFVPQSASEVETLIHKLGGVPPEATEYINVILKNRATSAMTPAAATDC